MTSVGTSTVRRKVLVVDDEAMVRQTLQFCLEDEYDITSVASGEEAVELALREDFPVVILDLCMEGISGIETLKRLKKIREAQNVIILTAYQSMETAITALNLGAFNYLTKPFDRFVLKEVISRGIEVYDQQIYRGRDLQQRLMSVHDRFFSLLCHEFNTPLNVILGFSEILASSVDDAEQQAWIQEIQGSGHHLHRILMEIVDYIGVSSQAEAGLEREFQLREVFTSIAGSLRDKEVELQVIPTPLLDRRLVGFKRSIAVIARKLVGMAAPQSSRVVVRAELDPADETGLSCLRLEVTGTGIHRSQMAGREVEQVFQPYAFSVKDSAGQRTSLGLELATCRKIAEHARGTVNGFFTAQDELGFRAEVLVRSSPVQGLLN